MSGLLIITWGVVFSALWASAFVAGKVALSFTDPMSLLCVRFGMAGVIMLLVALLRGDGRTLFRRDVLLAGAVMGALSNALYLGLSFVALKSLSAEAVILIVSTAPFITSGLSALLGGPRSVVQVLGAVTGFVGVYVVLSAKLGGGADLTGILLVFLGTLSFSVGTVFYRMRAAHHDPLAVNAIQNLFGSLLLVPFSPNLVGTVAALEHLPFLLAFLHLVVAVSIVDFLLWLALVRRIGAAHASSFHLLNPVFGVALSAAFLGAAISSRDVLGGSIVLLGLVIVSVDAVRQQNASRKTLPLAAEKTL
ncbi:DMT family transporter [Rhizobium oryzicola]|uniref:DMT family transporter n=1 Tax=Rhizobium oryzicola TaxID=1232668 RepID=A0ABT8SVC7_9HYPH|nr:DMT family transporter [Rhizobium oryzicola]MDO1582260.1 DMT family transporter [Rhizobium oryzicola]